jgi:carboxylesterase type B
MVWIYGGGFEGGDSTYDLYGPDYLLEKNVVVVSFNYRLGLLGFLSTGDTVAPGNNGLKDQLLALQWVRDNVRNFCGNPDDITLAGQSAGSASVAYHIQSPKSQGISSAILADAHLCL